MACRYPGRAALNAAAVLAACAAAVAGCKSEQAPAPPNPASEPFDRPARPPHGWHTLVNRRVGFSVSLPPGWTARKRRSATLIRSADELLAASVAADRSRAGRETPARTYVQQTLSSLPRFHGAVADPLARVRGSPYESARAEALGIAPDGRRQRVVVAAYRRPGLVTYAVVAFETARRGAPRHERELDRLLASLRARPPRL
jgi:hypothetical protein